MRIHFTDKRALAVTVCWVAALALTGSTDALFFMAPALLIAIPLFGGRLLRRGADRRLGSRGRPRRRVARRRSRAAAALRLAPARRPPDRLLAGQAAAARGAAPAELAPARSLRSPRASTERNPVRKHWAAACRHHHLALPARGPPGLGPRRQPRLPLRNRLGDARTCPASASKSSATTATCSCSTSTATKSSIYGYEGEPYARVLTTAPCR